jgi:hypothetical protein
MQDISVSYNRYRYLGNEFLTWLWYFIENEQADFDGFRSDDAVLELGNRIIIENRTSEPETVAIKGDEANLEEGVIALKKGGWVTELNLAYRINDQEWRFTLKGESLHVNSLKTPETAALETKDDLEGAFLEKMGLYEKAFTLIDTLFNHFIRLRISGEWKTETTQKMKRWITSK